MNWLQLIVSGVSALCGGFVGGWIVAFRIGQWRQRVEDHLETIEERLKKGDMRIDAVPVLQARLDIIVDELRELRKELREDFARVVTRQECDRRHKA